LTIPFTRKTDVEACCLLGDFGVSVAGRSAKIIQKVRELRWGDWTTQGLPFYGGNLTYHCTVNGPGTICGIEISHFKSPLITARLDGKQAGKIAFPPYQLDLGQLRGKHRLDLTVYGSRVNTFGAVHNCNKNLTWFGPPAWRSTGTDWSYDY